MESWPAAFPSTGYQPKGKTMGLDDKIDNAAEKLGGKAKEATGRATDDESLRT